MVWYEFNIVNQSMNELISKVGIELLGQLKKKQYRRQPVSNKVKKESRWNMTSMPENP